MDLYPYTFTPIYKEKIWGGRNLERLFVRALPQGQTIGESWELADLAEGTSVLANGPEAGKTLTEITRELGSDLLGATRPVDGRFPLLLKLLDANDILSLQVHPDARAVAEIGPPAALKTECWYIVESRDGMVYRGVRDGVTPEAFRKAIESDTVADLVQRYDVAGGDFHHLPAGTVHALGAGVVVAEVQTPSDTTYRVTDWGRGREIHVERSMQCIHFNVSDADPPGADAASGVLVDTPYFRVRRIAGDQARSFEVGQGRCAAFMMLAGPACRFSHAGTVERDVDVRPGDTIVLPAALQDARMTVEAGVMGLLIDLPEETS